MEKFQNKYRIASARLQGYDYGSNGFYFVTICTKNRECYFGSVVETRNCGLIVETRNCGLIGETRNCGLIGETRNCGLIGETRNCGSVVETRNCGSVVETRNCASLQPTPIGQIAIDYWTEIPKHYPFVELDEFVVMPNHIHGILFFNKPDKLDWQPNQFGVQSQNLAAVIRAFKSTTKRFANQNNIDFEWQTRYHDRIIRNEKALNAIRKYIINNPLKWNDDTMNGSVV